jgi:type IV pilus assembly protein PilA
MLTSLRKRLQKDEDGFTLIELMVVVLIIAILIAIAIPTFLGAQDRARDRGAQSELRNALTAAKTIATDDAGLFTSVTDGTLGDAEGSLTFAAAGAPTEGTISVSGGGATNPDFVFLYTASASGTNFGIATNRAGQVGYCRDFATAPTVSVDATTGDLVGCVGTSW